MKQSVWRPGWRCRHQSVPKDQPRTQTYNNSEEPDLHSENANPCCWNRSRLYLPTETWLIIPFLIIHSLWNHYHSRHH